MKDIWFLMYAGTSADGLGTGSYVGRTTNPIEALGELSVIANNPYSTGKIEAISDSKITIYSSASSIKKFVDDFKDSFKEQDV